MIHLAYAAFLAGGIAIAAPIIMHLLRRRPTEKEAFPSFMFLGAMAQKAQSRNSLRKWLVLLLRMLVIACLVLAFCWPFIPSFDEQPVCATAILWDASLSMQAKSYADEMKAKAHELIAKAGPKEPTLIGAVSQRIVWSGKFSSSPDALKRWFDENSSGAASSSFAYALAIADARLKDVKAKQRKIVVVTDRQALPWKDLKMESLLSPGAELAVLTPKKPGFKNIAVVRARAMAPFTEAGAPLPIEVELANYSQSPAEASLSIIVDGGRLDGAKVSLKPNETSLLSFVVSPQKLEPLACSAEIASDDDLPLDNVRHFALNPGKAPFVLATPLKPGADDFIQTAFMPSGSARSAEFNTARGRDFEELLEKASLAVVREPLDSASATALRKYLEDGGSAAILWSPGAGMRNLLLSFGVKCAASVRKSTESFGDIDFESPLFKKFLEAKVGGLFELRFFNPGKLLPPEGEARAIASFKDGSPAIIEMGVGKGRLTAFAFQMDRAASDWPAAPSFLPLWRELLSGSISLKRAQAQPQQEIAVGGSTELKDKDGKQLDLSKPGCILADIDGKPAFVAVNIEPEESNPAQLAESFDFKKLLADPSAKIEQFFADENQTELKLSEADAKGEPLWKLFLLLALIFSIAELMLSNRTAL